MNVFLQVLLGVCSTRIAVRMRNVYLLISLWHLNYEHVPKVVCYVVPFMLSVRKILIAAVVLAIQAGHLHNFKFGVLSNCHCSNDMSNGVQGQKSYLKEDSDCCPGYECLVTFGGLKYCI